MPTTTSATPSLPSGTKRNREVELVVVSFRGEWIQLVPTSPIHTYRQHVLFSRPGPADARPRYYMMVVSTKTCIGLSKPGTRVRIQRSAETGELLKRTMRVVK